MVIAVKPEGTVLIRIERGTRARLKQLAKDAGKTMSAMLRELSQDWPGLQRIDERLKRIEETSSWKFLLAEAARMPRYTGDDPKEKACDDAFHGAIKSLEEKGYAERR